MDGCPRESLQTEDTSLGLLHAAGFLRMREASSIVSGGGRTDPDPNLLENNSSLSLRVGMFTLVLLKGRLHRLQTSNTILNDHGVETI